MTKKISRSISIKNEMMNPGQWEIHSTNFPLVMSNLEPWQGQVNIFSSTVRKSIGRAFSTLPISTIR